MSADASSAGAKRAVEVSPAVLLPSQEFKKSRGEVAALTVDGRLDYSKLSDIEEVEYYNNIAKVLEAKAKGLGLLDEYGAYTVHARQVSNGKKKVDTKWGVKLQSDGSIKARLCGREYKWLEERDGCFAPTSSGATSRMVDYLAMKGDDDT